VSSIDVVRRPAPMHLTRRHQSSHHGDAVLFVLGKVNLVSELVRFSVDNRPG
jgi:hypothetical protein